MGDSRREGSNVNFAVSQFGKDISTFHQIILKEKPRDRVQFWPYLPTSTDTNPKSFFKSSKSWEFPFSQYGYLYCTQKSIPIDLIKPRQKDPVRHFRKSFASIIIKSSLT